MRKLRIIALLGLFAFVFSSCEKDEDFLIGKWNIDKMKYSFTLGGENFSFTMTDSAEDDLGWVEFKEGGSGTDDAGDAFTWTLSGDNLTITDSEETITMELTTKEDEKIVGVWTATETEGGETITVSYEIEMSKI